MIDRKFNDDDRQRVVDFVAAAGPEGALISDVVAQIAKFMADPHARRLVRQVLDQRRIHTTSTFRLREGSGFETYQGNGGLHGPAE